MVYDLSTVPSVRLYTAVALFFCVSEHHGLSPQELISPSGSWNSYAFYHIVL